MIAKKTRAELAAERRLANQDLCHMNEEQLRAERVEVLKAAAKLGRMGNHRGVHLHIQRDMVIREYLGELPRY